VKVLVKKTVVGTAFLRFPKYSSKAQQAKAGFTGVENRRPLLAGAKHRGPGTGRGRVHYKKGRYRSKKPGSSPTRYSR